MTNPKSKRIPRTELPGRTVEKDESLAEADRLLSAAWAPQRSPQALRIKGG